MVRADSPGRRSVFLRPGKWTRVPTMPRVGDELGTMGCQPWASTAGGAGLDQRGLENRALLRVTPNCHLQLAWDRSTLLNVHEQTSPDIILYSHLPETTRIRKRWAGMQEIYTLNSCGRDVLQRAVKHTAAVVGHVQQAIFFAKEWTRTDTTTRAAAKKVYELVRENAPYHIIIIS